MAQLSEYMKIRQYVIDLMRRHAEHGVRIMSERELCREFKVTRPTARRALKELIEEGYLIARQGQGTFINPGKVQNYAYLLRKFFTVMLIIGSGRNTDMDGFFMAIVERICNRFKSLPVNLRIANLNSTDPESARRELAVHTVDGILWVRPDARDSGVIAEFRRQFPVYVIGDIPCGDICHITADYLAGGEITARWFIEQGLRRIAFVGGTCGCRIKQAFYRGWVQGFARHGITHDEGLNADMESDICQKIKGFVERGEIDGFFSFGSEFAAVDTVLTQMGVPAGRYPIVIDENHYGEYGAQIRPTAKVGLFPDDISTIAAENLFTSMNDRAHTPKEIVFSPIILQ